MKMNSMHLVLAAALATGLCAAQAAETKAPSMRTGEPRSEATTTAAERQFSGKITGVNRQNKTITIEDKQFGRETLHIGSDTRVMRGKESAGWEQLRDGEEIRATARRSGDMNHALTVEIAR